MKGFHSFSGIQMGIDLGCISHGSSYSKSFNLLEILLQSKGCDSTTVECIGVIKYSTLQNRFGSLFWFTQPQAYVNISVKAATKNSISDGVPTLTLRHPSK